MRSQLVAFLKGSSHSAATLALFDRADVKAKLPDPMPRAALVALTGTAGEPAIAYFLAHNYVVRFGSLPDATRVAGITGVNPQVLTFNVRHQNEHFALLAGIFAHEILHHDGPPASPTEEVILHAVNNAVHMQLLARHPELATGGTELSRSVNDDLLLFVNSRVPGSPRSSILAPNGRGTAPGSARSKSDLYSHGSDFHSLHRSPSPADSSPAPAAFGAVLRELLVPGVDLPKPLTYSKKTAELFSRMNDTWLSPVDRLRVSVLLGLVSMDEITTYTGLSRAKAITTFKLAPILAAMD